MLSFNRASRSLRPLLLSAVAAAATSMLAVGLLQATPAHAAASTAIVSLNVNSDDTRDSFPTTRPQTRTATVQAATLTGGVMVSWDTEYDIYIFAAPKAPLKRGVYTNLQINHAGSTQVGVSVDFNSRGIDEGEGLVDVLDVASDAAGRLTRFDIAFTTSTSTAYGQAFGELRMNEPDTVSGLSPTATVLHWPQVTLHQPAVVATESFHNTSSVAETLGSAALEGISRADYTVTHDACSRRTLRPGADCSLDVAFGPKKGGPGDAELRISTGSRTLRVPLSGTTPLGSSSITTSGKDGIDDGRTLTFNPVLGVPLTVPASPGLPGTRQFRFPIDPEGTQAKKNWLTTTVMLILSGPSSPPALGTHSTGHDGDTYGLSYTADYQYCGEGLSGSEDVKAFKVDEKGDPTYALVDFKDTCKQNDWPTATLTGELRYQYRKDTSAPSRPTGLTVAGNHVSWKRSTSRDLAFTVVRVQAGGGGTATSGWSVAAGTGTSGTLPTLRRGQTYIVSAYSVDTSGNVSTATNRRLTF